MSRCGVCHKEISDDSKFCGNCGASLAPAANNRVAPVPASGSSGKKGLLKKAWSVLLWLLLAILVLFTILLLLASANLGIHAYVLSSGSMSPTIKTASLVFVRSASHYQVGDVITFENPGRTLTTHRIVEVTDDMGETSYITQGDANDTPDANPVSASSVKGRVVFHVPYIGRAISFFKTIPGLVIFVAIFAVLLIEAFWDDIERLSEKVKGSRQKAGAPKSK